MIQTRHFYKCGHLCSALREECQNVTPPLNSPGPLMQPRRWFVTEVDAHVKAFMGQLQLRGRLVLCVLKAGLCGKWRWLSSFEWTVTSRLYNVFSGLWTLRVFFQSWDIMYDITKSSKALYVFSVSKPSFQMFLSLSLFPCVCVCVCLSGFMSVLAATQLVIQQISVSLENPHLCNYWTQPLSH